MSRARTHIAIVGSGFSGLGMAIELKRAGFTHFTIYEKDAEVGGTWWANTYPGAACDVPSHLYSFSFELNPDWSRTYSRQGEILDYLRHCVDRYDLRPHIRFGTALTGAEFDPRAGEWTIRLSTGDGARARALVLGTGGLSQPALPELPGRDRFQGTWFHSARWNHDYPLDGRRVAVIGTGASAVQFVPQIAPRVAELLLFQRTPPWILPKPDRAFTELEKRWLRRSVTLRRLYRLLVYLRLEPAAVHFLRGGLLARWVEAMARRHISAKISEPKLRELVTPDYTIGCKRILISNDYYPALGRDNVELVTDPIARIVPEGVETRSGRVHAVDAIVYGTGFAPLAPLADVPIVGLDGVELGELWERNGAEAYYGTTVSGFPNLYLLAGPNVGLGHNSMVYMIESQIRYVVDALATLEREQLRYADLRPQVQRSFNDDLQSKMSQTVWHTGCSSWYQTDDGRNFTLWPGFTFQFRHRTRSFDPSVYTVVGAAADGTPDRTSV